MSNRIGIFLTLRKQICLIGTMNFQYMIMFWGRENWNIKTVSSFAEESVLSSEFMRTKNWFSVAELAWMSDTLLKLRSH